MMNYRAVIAPVMLAVWLAAPASPQAQEQKPFSRELEWQGERFTITATNAGSINELTITPPAALSAQKPIKREIDGTVSGAEIDDLDNNRRPEIYVYVNSAGSGGYGDVIAYEVDKSGKRLRSIAFNPALTGKNSAGYMGHDDFAVVEGTLVRRFKLYRPGDTNAAPSGGMRQLQYKLRQGPRGPRLVLDKSLSY
jgi:hypothetical protein